MGNPQTTAGIRTVLRVNGGGSVHQSANLSGYLYR
jgi:hypothetical protein